MKVIDYPCSNCVTLYNEEKEKDDPKKTEIISLHEILESSSDNWAKLECVECGQVRFVKNLDLTKSINLEENL